MGGQVRLVHVTTLKRCRARGFFSPLSCGAGILLPGCPPHLSTLSHVRGCADSVAVAAFAAHRVVMLCLWVSPPYFLIVYAPAMRRVAYYALGWGCSCARLAVWRCRASRVVVCGVAAHVCACGPFVVPLGRERGALASHSCSFLRMLRCPSGAALRGAPWFLTGGY